MGAAFIALSVLTLLAGVFLLVWGHDRSEGMMWAGFAVLIVFGIEMIGVWDLASAGIPSLR